VDVLSARAAAQWRRLRRANLGLVMFVDPPASAAWRHLDGRVGFEVVFFRVEDHAITLDGVTAAIEAGRTWVVDYTIEIDRSWRTRRATVRGRSSAGLRSTVLDVAGDGVWLVDGVPAPHLAGCVDVDLESSAVTNALPVHRLGLGVDQRAEAPAAYVRAVDLSVERLDQTYIRRADEADTQRYDYTAPAFAVSVQLHYDRYGLVVDYPGIARRAS
jgi:uncharacterized protein